MKKFIIGVCIILASLMGCKTTKAQTIQDNKTFIQKSQSSSTTKDIATGYHWQDLKGNKYPIYLHKFTKGDKAGKWGAYVIKKSQKSGKEYKYYIPDNEAITAEIKRNLKI